VGWGDVLVEVDATVGEFSEGSLLLDFGGLLGIVFVLRRKVFVSIDSSISTSTSSIPTREHEADSARDSRQGNGESMIDTYSHDYGS
jgi:hypothetical protein